MGGQVKSVLLGLNKPIKYMSESDRQLINLHALHLAEATVLLIQLIYNAKTHLLVPVVSPMCEVIVSLQTFGKGRRVFPCSPISTKHIHALCPQPTARSPPCSLLQGPGAQLHWDLDGAFSRNQEYPPPFLPLRDNQRIWHQDIVLRGSPSPACLFIRKLANPSLTPSGTRSLCFFIGMLP